MRFWNNFHLVLSVKIFKSQIDLNFVKGSKITFIYYFIWKHIALQSKKNDQNKWNPITSMDIWLLEKFFCKTWGSVLKIICIVQGEISTFIMLAHWNNSSRVNRSFHSDTLFWFRANQSLSFLLSATCLAEKQHIPIDQYS
jgi:hypothetical protein